MIRWDFIADVEGGMCLSGYVPKDKAGGPDAGSGVTIAAGVDLGRLTRDELALLTPDLQEKVAPYFSMHGGAALRALRARPLRINQHEGETLMALKAVGFIKTIRHEFDARSHVPFARLADGPATVIMSLTWQYGDPWSDKKCGDFWRQACAGDWTQTAAYLTAGFPDGRYPSRRRKEADFLLKNRTVFDGQERGAMA